MTAATRLGPDDPFLLMINAWWEPLQFSVRDALRDLPWVVEVDTSDPRSAGHRVDSAAGVTLNGRSLMLLRGTRTAAQG